MKARANSLKKRNFTRRSQLSARRKTARGTVASSVDYGLLEPRQLLAAITVVDINDSLQSSLDNESLVAFNGGAAGVADDAGIGRELWFSNETLDGNYQIDVVPGIASSSPTGLTVVGQNIFFAAFDQNQDRALWITDGTESGTQKLSAFHELIVEDAAVVNGVVYFAADDGIHGLELWKSDGTIAGTQLVKDVHPGEASSRPEAFITLGNEFFFKTFIGTGFGLWKSDGTESGTRFGANLPNSTGTFWAVEPLDAVFFESSDELWVSNGTVAGTQQLFEFQSMNFQANSPFALGESLLFGASTDGITANLWKSDGTVAGTQMVKEINTDNAFFSAPRSFTQRNNEVFFRVDKDNEAQLWKSDGSEQGTQQVPLQITLADNPFAQLAVVGDDVVYSGTSVETGRELWATSGTLRSNRVFADFVPGPDSSYAAVLLASGDHVFARTSDPSQSVWATDGQIQQIVTSAPTNTGRSDLGNFADVNGQLYFSAFTQFFPVVYSSDGTPQGTDPVDRIPLFQPPFYSLFDPIGKFTEVNGNLLINANTSSGQTELWIYDPATDLANRVPDVTAGPLVNSENGLAYFAQNNASVGRGIWETDGTLKGTQLILSFADPIESLFVVDQTFYFQADDEVWVSDGTSAGTQRLVLPGVSFQFPGLANVTQLNGTQIVFTVARQLWVTDGSNEGTESIADYNGSSFSSEDFVRLNNRVYYTSGQLLYATDGTSAGTVSVFDDLAFKVFPGIDESGVDKRVAVFNNVLYIAGAEQLFKLDLSVAGDAVPVSPTAMHPNSLQVFNGKLYFSGETPEAGRELWVTDGTSDGTMMVIDHVPGPADTDINSLTSAGDNLYFVYDSIATGAELGVLTITPPTGVDFGPAGNVAFEDYEQTFDQPYSAETGFGWQQATGLNSLSLARGNELNNDKVALRNGTFALDVVNGMYQVDVHLGAVVKTDAIRITTEGQLDQFTPLAGPNVVRSSTVTVIDGQLTIEFDGMPGLDNLIRVAGITLTDLGGQRPVLSEQPFSTPGMVLDNLVRLPESIPNHSTDDSIIVGQLVGMRRLAPLSLAGSETIATDRFFSIAPGDMKNDFVFRKRDHGGFFAVDTIELDFELF